MNEKEEEELEYDGLYEQVEAKGRIWKEEREIYINEDEKEDASYLSRQVDFKGSKGVRKGEVDSVSNAKLYLLLFSRNVVDLVLQEPYRSDDSLSTDKQLKVCVRAFEYFIRRKNIENLKLSGILMK